MYHPPKFLQNCIQSNFIIVHISNEEFVDINTLENKSTGPSSIPLHLLSLIPDLSIPLAFINFSLTPELLKLVIPLHKGGGGGGGADYI